METTRIACFEQTNKYTNTQKSNRQECSVSTTNVSKAKAPVSFYLLRKKNGIQRKIAISIFNVWFRWECDMKCSPTSIYVMLSNFRVVCWKFNSYYTWVSMFSVIYQQNMLEQHNFMTKIIRWKWKYVICRVVVFCICICISSSIWGFKYANGSFLLEMTRKMGPTL